MGFVWMKKDGRERERECVCAFVCVYVCMCMTKIGKIKEGMYVSTRE